MIILIKNANDYETQEVLFNEMNSTLFRSIYFTVKVKTINGFLSKDTKAIFNAHVLSSRSVENFNNKKVLIGYNNKTEEIVVLKKVE